MVRGQNCVLIPILLSDILCFTTQNTPGRPHFQLQMGFQQGYLLFITEIQLDQLSESCLIFFEF